ncbi:MAG TPA: hypothetical protein VGS07_29905 [Thermoanaerobaculia bacterium]|nr:hypothetical protein [Thermoanaerobaculia bacterium]
MDDIYLGYAGALADPAKALVALERAAGPPGPPIRRATSPYADLAADDLASLLAELDEV